MSNLMGKPAPAFTLFDTEKKAVNLADYKGKNVVVLFFPLAFTGVCTTELCSIRDNIGTYNAANAVVLGISVDSLFTLGKFKEEQKLNFPLLSDFNKAAASAFDRIREGKTPAHITTEDLEAAIARTRASVTADIRQRFAEEAERFARV